MRRALITGISGQDGVYLARFLRGQGYDVFGLARHATQNERLISFGVTCRDIDLLDAGTVKSTVREWQPDEVYHLAAMTDVAASFRDLEGCRAINVEGTRNLLEAARKSVPTTRLFYASSSAVFGSSADLLTENSIFNPITPYGASKAEAHLLCREYREVHRLFVGVGILFNHESPLRGPQFLSGKIAAAFRQPDPYLELGNLDAQRDWGYAPDYVEAMHAILRHDHPEDFVVATGVARSVRDFVIAAAGCVGITLAWTGAGPDETAHDTKTDRLVVKVNPDFYRPTEPTVQLGDASKAHQALGWSPRTSFDEMVQAILKHPDATL